MTPFRAGSITPLGKRGLPSSYSPFELVSPQHRGKKYLGKSLKLFAMERSSLYSNKHEIQP